MATVRTVFSLSVSLLLLSSKGVFPRSGIDFGSRRQRDVQCTDNQYPYANKCCINCPAGTHVKTHCTNHGERGRCQECDYGTYTAHPNGLNHCVKCTKCHLDQDIVRHCMPTQDTECGCKAGTFCDPEEACELCRRCSKCAKDEEIQRNCTSTTNTVCKKRQPGSGSASVQSANAVVIVPVVIFSILGVLILGIAIFFFLKKKCTSTGSGLDPPEEIKVEPSYPANRPTEERRNGETRKPSFSSWSLVRGSASAPTEDKHMLCHSLSSSASNSQHSLIGLQSTLPVMAPHTRPGTAWMPDRREEEHFLKLVPVNGEESLRKCFDYFEEIEFGQHKKYFRLLGIKDNVMKSRDHLEYTDKIHELLNIWVEKEGREASLNQLLEALFELDQRLTAETVKQKAVENGHYVLEGL